MTVAESNALPAVEPPVNPETKHFFKAASEGQLAVPRCRACNTWIWYPRQFCPVCKSMGADWSPASGRGTVYTYTIVARGTGLYRDSGPYVVAYVELEEGPRVLTNIVGCAPDVVRIGMPVRAVFQPAGPESALVRFTPA